MKDLSFRILTRGKSKSRLRSAETPLTTAARRLRRGGCPSLVEGYFCDEKREHATSQDWHRCKFCQICQIYLTQDAIWKCLRHAACFRASTLAIDNCMGRQSGSVVGLRRRCCCCISRCEHIEDEKQRDEKRRMSGVSPKCATWKVRASDTPLT